MATPYIKPFLELFSIKDNTKAIFTRAQDALPALDGLRAISILWVMCFHVYILTTLSISKSTARSLVNDTPWYMNWIWNGDKGVDIFFVLSGFLISGLLFNEFQRTRTINLKRFYLRRFLRLTPVFWLVLALYYIVNAPNRELLMFNAFYINNFVSSELMPMTWSWSLAVEEQFYLLFPLFLLLIFFKSRNKMAWMLGLLAGSLAIRFAILFFTKELWNYDLNELFNIEKGRVFNIYFDSLYMNLYTRFGPFICGIIASYLYQFQQIKLDRFFRSSQSKPGIIISLLVVILFGLAPSYHENLDLPQAYHVFSLVFNRTLFAMATAYLLLSALFPYSITGKAVNRFLSLKIWVPIAHLSYSSYLIHIFVIVIVHIFLAKIFKSQQLALATLEFKWMLIGIPFTALFTFLVAALLFVLVEKPFMKLRNLMEKEEVSKKPFARKSELIEEGSRNHQNQSNNAPNDLPFKLS